MTRQYAFEELLCDTEQANSFTQHESNAETIDVAQRRAAQVFELLLTVLSDSQIPRRTNPAS